LGYISVAESLGISSTTFTQCARKLPNSVPNCVYPPRRGCPGTISVKFSVDVNG